MELTHFNKDGRARMVDVGDKKISKRKAIATGKIYMKESTIRLITEGEIKKGDVLSVAQVSGIMGSKRTSELIPMCHNIFISGVDIDFEIEKNYIRVYAEAKTEGQTGIEMESLVAVSTALLTIYDMCKAVDKEMLISDIQLIEKTGGKSGDLKFNIKKDDK